MKRSVLAKSLLIAATYLTGGGGILFAAKPIAIFGEGDFTDGRTINGVTFGLNGNEAVASGEYAKITGSLGVKFDLSESYDYAAAVFEVDTSDVTPAANQSFFFLGDSDHLNAIGVKVKSVSTTDGVTTVVAGGLGRSSAYTAADDDANAQSISGAQTFVLTYGDSTYGTHLYRMVDGATQVLYGKSDNNGLRYTDDPFAHLSIGGPYGDNGFSAMTGLKIKKVVIYSANNAADFSDNTSEAWSAQAVTLTGDLTMSTLNSTYTTPTLVTVGDGETATTLTVDTAPSRFIAFSRTGALACPKGATGTIFNGATIGATITIKTTSSITLTDVEVAEGGRVVVNAGQSISLGGNFTNNGTIDAQAGGNIYITGSLENNGEIIANTGGQVHVTGTLTNNKTITVNEAGVLDLSGGTLVEGEESVIAAANATGAQILLPSSAEVTVPSTLQKGLVKVRESVAQDGTVTIKGVSGDTRVIIQSADAGADSTAERDGVTYAEKDENNNIVATFTPATSGKICWHDWEYNQNLTDTGSTPQNMGWWSSTFSNDGYIADEEQEGNYLVPTSSRLGPTTGFAFGSEWSLAIRCSVPTISSGIIITVGNKGTGFIGLTSGDATGKVVLGKSQGGAAYQEISSATVASPSSLHVFVVTKTASAVALYCDGDLIKREMISDLAIGNGLQLGTCFEGVVSGIVANGDAATSGQTDYVRLYEGVIGANLIKALADENPFVSTADAYTRTVSGSENEWVSTAAWSSNGTEDVEAPAADGVVTLTASEAATVAVNLSATPNYERLTFEGAALTLSPVEDAAPLSAASVVVNNALTVKYGAADFSNSRIAFGEEGALVFDFSDYDFTAGEATIPLTGVTVANKVTVRADHYAERLSLAYDADSSTYSVSVSKTVVVPYAESITLTDDTTVYLPVANSVEAGIPYPSSTATTLLAGDTLYVANGSNPTLTLNNTVKLADIQVVSPLTFANDPAAHTAKVTVSAGSVTMNAKPTLATTGSNPLALVFAENWKGRFIVGWSSGGSTVAEQSFNPDDYGTEKSTVVVKNLTTSYLPNGQNARKEFANFVSIDGTWTLNNGYVEATNVLKAVTSADASAVLNFDFAPNQGKDYINYEIQAVTNFAGTVQVNGKTRVSIANIYIDARTTTTYLKMTTNANTRLVGLASTVVKSVEQLEQSGLTVLTQATGVAYDAASGGLVKALAAIGETTYASVDAAVTAAGDDTTITTITLLNGATAETAPDGWEKGDGVLTRIVTGGLDPASGTLEATVTYSGTEEGEALTNAVIAATAMTPPSGVEAETYKGYFTYSVTDNGDGTYTVTLTGIAETVVANACTSALSVLTADGSGVTVPAGLYYAITPLATLNDATAETVYGQSTGAAVSVAKPGGEGQGFIKIELGAQSLEPVTP